MKPILILGATFAATTSLLALTTGAQAATQCQAEIVKGRTSHWTYRLIDGRKCWYEGKTQLPKSELYWADGKAPEAEAAPEARQAPAAPANPRSTNAQASPPQAEEPNDPEDGSCCWPPQKPGSQGSQANQDSFEARWHSFGPAPRN